MLHALVYDHCSSNEGVPRSLELHDRWNTQRRILETIHENLPHNHLSVYAVTNVLK